MRLATLLAVIALAWLPLPAQTAKKTAPSSSKKTTSRKTARRGAPKPPPVSAKARQQASEHVAGYLERAAEASIENPRALVPFFELLYRHQAGQSTGPLRILHYGDSHTASDDWTGTLRILFQEKFGDGGSGYSYAGRPWRGYRRLDVRGSASSGWRSEGVGRNPGDGMHGLGGVSLFTTRPRESISLDADCDRMELYYLQQPDGGSLQLYDNGIPVDVIPTGGALGPGYAQYESGPGFHRFELKTLDRAPVRLFGWVAEKLSGVTYETLGINGAQASLILNWDEQILASHIARRDPALIVLAYGTNEAGNPNWTLESYREMFTTMLRRIRQAAPAASLLVVGPPDRFQRSRGRWLPYEKVDRIIAAEREAAVAEGCAFLDLKSKMGGAGAMRNWVLSGLAQQDHVHFTTAGYRKLGDLLFHDLMGQYSIYNDVRGRVIGQTNYEPARPNP